MACGSRVCFKSYEKKGRLLPAAVLGALRTGSLINFNGDIFAGLEDTREGTSKTETIDV